MQEDGLATVPVHLMSITRPSMPPARAAEGDLHHGVDLPRVTKQATVTSIARFGQMLPAE